MHSRASVCEDSQAHEVHQVPGSPPVDGGEVKKAAVRTQEAFLESEPMLAAVQSKGHLSKLR